MTTEHTLDSLLDNYAFAVRSYALAPDADAADGIDAARAALLDYIAAHYVRRDAYTAARGILPWTPGDDLPEERIRRLRDGGRQHTLHLDDAGRVVSGVPDFEGER